MSTLRIIGRTLIVVGLSAGFYAHVRQVMLRRELRRLERSYLHEQLAEMARTPTLTTGFTFDEKWDEGRTCAKKRLEAARTFRGRWVCVKSTFTHTGEEDY